MRVLVATTGNDGHFGPLVPVARACVAAGHEVQVAAPASFARTVLTAGFAHAPFDDPAPEVIGPVMAGLPSLSFEEADACVIREVFGRIDAQAALPALRALLDAWRPDVVVRESAELGSLAAAEAAGVPHAQVAIGMQELTRALLGLVEAPLAELGALAGVADGRLVASAAAEVVISTVPEGLDRAGDDDYRDDVSVVRVAAPSTTAHRDERLPAWGDPGLPLVYVTLGSVAGSLPPFAGLFAQALDALAALPVRVLMTVGRGFDPERLGPVPANAHVVPWWPQDDALLHASAVLCHGGFGTTMGALAAGLPVVVAPIFSSDQAINGRHVAAAGAGRTVEPGPDPIGRAVTALEQLLRDPTYAVSARALEAEAAALPDMAAAVAALADLAS